MEHHLTTYITHDTLISALGFGTQENLEAIRSYHSGITCLIYTSDAADEEFAV